MGTSKKSEATVGAETADRARARAKTMSRVRSNSVDLVLTHCVSRLSSTLLCGADTSGLSSTFYSKVDQQGQQGTEEENNSSKKDDGTLRRLCDTIKRPFRNKSRSAASKPHIAVILPSDDDPLEPVLFTATAIRDHVPHPYDNTGLPFRAGDEIEVTSVNENGVWSGWCNNRSGQFKFIDVKKVDPRRRENFSQSFPQLENICQRSKSVTDLLSSINLENLIPKFVLNGFDTTASIKTMNDDDLEYLGVTDDHIKDLIMGTIDWLNLCEPSQKPAGAIKQTQLQPDSGYTSVESISPSSFLHSVARKSQTEEDDNLLIVTPL